MKKLVLRMIEVVFVSFLSLLLVIPQAAFGQSHVISSADLQRDVASASAIRQQNIAELQSLFTLPEARTAIKSADINYQQVTQAIPQLSDKDLARLAQLSRTSQKRFAAGNLSNRDLLWILIAAAALILIIVAARD